MTDETRPNDLEQVLLPPQPSTRPPPPPLATIKFRIFPLCCLFLLFVFQLIFILCPYYWKDNSKLFLAASQCFGLVTCYIAYKFNRLEIGVGEKNDAKNPWALEYLWDIQSGVAINVILLFVQGHMNFEHFETINSNYRTVNNLDIESVSRSIMNVNLIVLALLFYLGYVARGYFVDLKSQQQQQEQLCVTDRILTGFQIASKLCIFVLLYLPNLETHLVYDIIVIFGEIVLWSLICYFLCRASLKHLFWTPSSIIFESVEMQTRIINETMRLYVFMGFVILFKQTYGIGTTSNDFYGSLAFVGLLCVRVLHILLCVLMNTMAINLRKARLGARYFVVDVVFSMLNVLGGIGAGLYQVTRWYTFNYMEITLFIGILLFPCIKLGILIVRICRNLDAQIKNNGIGWDLRVLNGCFVILSILFRPPLMGMFWLVNITSGACLYYFCLHLSTAEESNEGISI